MIALVTSAGLQSRQLKVERSADHRPFVGSLFVVYTTASQFGVYLLPLTPPRRPVRITYEWRNHPKRRTAELSVAFCATVASSWSRCLPRTFFFKLVHFLIKSLLPVYTRQPSQSLFDRINIRRA